MSRAFPVLAVLIAAVCLPQELTTADAMAILRNSPWSYEVKTSFAYYNPGRGTFKRPPGTSPSSYPDPNARMPPNSNPVALTVTWESARPVLEARKSLGQPTMATPYTISISGIPRALTENPAFHPRTIQDQATLKSGRHTIKATSADIIPRGNTLTVVFQFSTELTITPNDPEVRFRAFVLTSEIAVKFQPPKMVHESQLRL